MRKVCFFNFNQISLLSKLFFRLYGKRHSLDPFGSLRYSITKATPNHIRFSEAFYSSSHSKS